MSLNLQYGFPAQRRNPPSWQLGDAISQKMDSSMLAWGAKQVKWRPGRTDVYPYLPTARPPAPNYAGIHACMTKDTESGAYATPFPSTAFLEHTQPAPAYWSFHLRY